MIASMALNRAPVVCGEATSLPSAEEWQWLVASRRSGALNCPEARFGGWHYVVHVRAGKSEHCCYVIA